MGAVRDPFKTIWPAVAVGVATLLALSACGPRTGAAPPAAARAATGRAAGEQGAQTAADFYRGKTMTIVVGYGAGGGFDSTARVLAKHLGSHIPGNPNIVVENMDGAGSLIAANHLYNVAKPDGLTIGTFNEQQVLNQTIGMDGVQFDARKFSWIGSALKNTTACTIRADSPYKKAEDFLRKDLPPLLLGGTAPGANTDDFPKLLAALFGTNLRLVSGYRGTADIRLATESREVDGMCWSWESLQATAKHWLDTDFITLPIYQAQERHPKLEERFPNARRAEDLVADEQTKKLIRAANAPGDISKPFVGPPGIPADRLKALQDAFTATMQDPAFLTDTEQARLEIDSNSGEKTAQIVNEILSLPPDLAKRLTEIRK